MTDESKKYMKYAVIVILFIVVAVILYYMFKGSSDPWKVVNDGDVNGYDIEISPSGTLDEDKKHAIDLGAKSFMRRAGQTFYKSANSPQTTVKIPGQPQVLYIKQ